MNFSSMIYDIPVTCPMPNPSPRLRRVAVRISLSTWVLKNEDVPWGLVHTMIEAGCTVDIVKFDGSEASHLTRMVVRALKSDLVQAKKRMEQSIARLENAVRDRIEGVTVDGPDLGDYEKRAERCDRAYDRLLADFRLAAERFEIDPETLQLSEAVSATHAIREGVRQKAKIFTDLVEQVKARDAGLARAAADDQVPVGILTDFLQEEGEDVHEEMEAFV